MSGDALYYQASQTGEEVSQTLSFRDGTDQWASAFADAYDPTRDVTYNNDVPLAEFFARPMKVASYTWSTSDVTPFYQTIDPWSLFFNNTRVANRISNFQNFSGNLHVKFVINGNSFLYGRLMADYFPLRAYDAVSVTTGTAASDINNLVQASQRLHIYLDPCESQAGEMTLPFIWFYDKINLPLGEFSSLGTLYMRQLQALKHANAASGAVNITMFVWATNVKLSMPTVTNISGIVAQSGSFDEYGTGPVSGMASAIASSAGKLAGVPHIGKYARATSMMASAMGQIAQLFGFSKPTVIDDYSDMRPSYVSRIANANGGDNVAKLSVDAKQELTIDPSVIGLSGMDELALNGIVKKESYLTQFPWTTARVPGDLLFSSRVGPVWSYISSRYYLPAVTFASLPFKYWRGSMIYRFQIVASGYHKGRLLIVWDPYIQTTAPETNVQYSKIVDLADERDFTFEVGWGSTKAWATVPQLGTTEQFRTTTAWTTASANYNGTFSVYVLNELTVPNVTVNNDIAINVFVAGCDDYKLAVPVDTQIASLVTVPSITPQSGAFEEVATEDKNAPRHEMAKEVIAACEPLTDATDLVYMGESIRSFRQLMKRYSLWSVLSTGTAQSANSNTSLKMPDFPGGRGYSLYGATNTVPGNINPSNTTIMHYLALAYLGYRGGIRWKVVVEDTVTTGNNLTSVSRSATLNDYTGGSWLTSIPDVVTSSYLYAKNKIATTDSFQNGGHLTVSRQPVIEFELPYYQDRRFSSTRNLGYNNVFAADDLSHRLITKSTTGNIQSFYLLMAGAEDATFVGFQGLPAVRKDALP